MPLFENQTCPVCQRLFEADDDVVYCPECGTPHHRECYRLIGHCVNQGLHRTNYSYFEEHKAAADGDTAQLPGGFYIPSPSQQEKKGDTGESANGNTPRITMTAPSLLPEEYEKSSEMIDGESVTDIAATVRASIPRFIGIFKKQSESGKKAGWNWSAFFFGSLYFLYRKMYRQGIALLCAVVLLLMGSSLLMTKLAPDTTALMQEAVTLSAQNDAEGFTAKLMEAQSASDLPKATALVYAFLGIVLLIRILAALFADRIYKSTVFRLIKSVTEQLDNGASFQTSFMGNEEFDLSQEQMKRLYLARKGGVSIFAPLAALLIVDLLITFF